jgi:hypothetical protein
MRNILVLVLVVYLASYAALRVTQAETWEGDGQTYVIFPGSAPWLYFAFRPLAYMDGQLTEMRFHIGPHQ